ncbi:MAG: hypothetical protein JW716_05105 [Candidatus Aenigmarchaeota archaeon]|nr:hypothetical protein [Candidatus Aenigmarchaeota archaeon]
MKVLLDTNIVIHREATTVVNDEIGSLFAWFDKLHYEKCIHPLTLEEIEKHKDQKVIRTFKIKLNNYVLLKTEAPYTPAVTALSQKMDKSQNDINDTRLINELVNNRVDFLISEDKWIHEKARLLDIDSRVFKINSFLEKVTSENPSLVDYKTLSVRKEYFGNIKLADTFFDTFRHDYKGFYEWFNKKSEEPAYVCIDREQTLAFLYVKKENEDEDYSDINPVFPKKKRLKIGTFKVNLNGFRLGERFLKIIFDNALKQRVDEIYVTIFNNLPEEKRLIDLLLEWGFKLWGTKKSSSGEEEVYVRDFSKSFNISAPKSTFPYISLESDVYLNPIYPLYHTNLFPDSILNTESPDDFIENEPFRNALSKVFVSRSITRNLKSGDIIVFYRTGGLYKSVITTIGIVESVITNIKNENEFLALCRKRSVFSNEELSDQWNHSKYKPFIVNFLYAYSFPHRINMKRLIELGVIRGVENAPRGFERISKSEFEKIIKETKTDENIIVN